MTTQIPGQTPLETSAPSPSGTADSLPAEMAAFEATRAARAALRPEQLSRVFADALSAASLAGAAAEKPATFAAEIFGLPNSSTLLEDVKRNALAAEHAQYRLLTAEIPREELAALIEQLKARRDTLHADILALVQRGILGAEQIAGFTNSSGHRAITYDVILLCTALRAGWSRIEGKTALTMAEIAEAHELARKVGQIVSLKEVSDKAQGEASDDRQRAFALMVDSYDELRRAISYIRWYQGDASDVAPSMAAHRNGRSRGAKNEESSDLPAAPTGLGTPVAGAPTVAANGASADFHPGMPSSSPFFDG